MIVFLKFSKIYDRKVHQAYAVCKSHASVANGISWHSRRDNVVMTLVSELLNLRFTSTKQNQVMINNGGVH